VRLVGYQALDVSGRYPEKLTFDHGAFTESHGRNTAILIGSNSALLFDYKGPGNRFELLITSGDQSILYRRVDERPSPRADADRIRDPGGIRLDRKGDLLEGRFDLVLGRADLYAFGPSFEHYPRHVRITGRFALPRGVESVGPTTGPTTTADASFEPPGLEQVDLAWLMKSFAGDLPALRHLGLLTPGQLLGSVRSR
jgi:hypothetical protein